MRYPFHSARDVRARKPPTSQWFHAYRLSTIKPHTYGRRAAYYMCISDMTTAPGTDSSSIQTVCCSYPARRTERSRHLHVCIRPLHAASRNGAVLGLRVGYPRTAIPLIFPRG